MKKTQKRLGNKGFSLVELIVVIAIMAVLVGVLAPTLVKNIEKSRKSTDLQNLDTLRGAVVTALSDENVNNKVGNGGTYTISTDSTSKKITVTADSTATGGTELQEALQDSMPSSISMKSKAAGTTAIKVTISSEGAVSAYVGASESAAVPCKNTKDSDGNAQKLLSK